MTVGEHRAALYALLGKAEPIITTVSEAVGLTVARDVRAELEFPRFDNSAMDGFALPIDVLRHGPGGWPISAVARAGDEVRLRVAAGSVQQTMTGATLPTNTAAVVAVEDTSGFAAVGDIVHLHTRATVGQNIRLRGEDVQQGDLVVAAGTVMDSRKAALLPAVGVEAVHVYPRPQVLVVSTGLELHTANGQAIPPSRTVDTNGPMLRSLLLGAGCDVVATELCGDEPNEIVEVLEQYRDVVDLVVTTGGISEGTHEPVRLALQRLLRFYKVNMRPGAPQGLGTVANVRVITLPGNPVAAYCSFELFLRPALGNWMGSPSRRQVERVWWDAGSHGAAPYWRWILATRSADGLRRAGSGRSGSLHSLAKANRLVMLPPATKGIVEVDALVLD